MTNQENLTNELETDSSHNRENQASVGPKRAPKNLKPWQNSDGSLKSDDELKKVSKDWSPEQWEDYLKSIEGYRRENVSFSNEELESLSSDDSTVLLYSIAQEEKYPITRIAIRACISQLPPQQRQVIELTFWEDLSQYEIAEKMNISRNTVRGYLERAKENLRKMLTTGKVVSYTKGIRELLKKSSEKNLSGESIFSPEVLNRLADNDGLIEQFQPILEELYQKSKSSSVQESFEVGGPKGAHPEPNFP